MFEEIEQKFNSSIKTMPGVGLDPKDLEIDSQAVPVLEKNKEEMSYETKLDQFKSAIGTNYENKKSSKKKIIIIIIVILVLAGISSFFIFSKNIFGKSVNLAIFSKNVSNKQSEKEPIQKQDEVAIVDQVPEVSTSTDSSTINEENTSSTDVILDLISENKSTELLDSDGDGLLDIYEQYYETDSNNSDSDGDRYSDGKELIGGYNPKGSGLIKDDKNIFYFAYGSNMSLDTMNQRCGANNFVGFKDSTLNDYSFYFYNRGFANIKPSQGNNVKGVLYRINQKCFDDLDQVEGYPSLYQRAKVSIQNTFGNFESWVYIVENDDTKGTPSDSYLNTVISGAKEYGLPSEYTQFIISSK